MQDRFGSRAQADRLLHGIVHESFTEADKAFVEECHFFFLATADMEGRPDCSFKGGEPGFVRVLAPDLLVFPDYDGNGMFKSLGNIEANPHVGMLFLTFEGRPRRIRVNGTAALSFDDPLLATFPGGQVLVRVKPQKIFANCPRYIPMMQMMQDLAHAPSEQCSPSEATADDVID